MMDTMKDMGRCTGRFAPTPSGRMHAGNLYCALLAWLSARRAGGRFILRCEDLDALRTSPEYARLIEEDLLWLGLDWDEGGSAGGPCAPYSQSARTEIYETYFERLRRMGALYPCFCSRGELHAAQAPHLSDGNIVYDGRCGRLTPDETARKSRIKTPCTRLRVPGGTIAFTDGVYGPQSADLAKSWGDFTVRRSDGVFAYQLAVVVDDALMGVREVVRARDLLCASFPQIALHRMLGFAPPAFSHIPLLCAPGGRRLSKRELDFGAGRLRERFRRPEAAVGKFAFLAGLTDRDEPLSARELTPLFDWKKIPREDIVPPPAFFE